jgi:hypothetical protein
MRMRLNKRMRAHLYDLRRREVDGTVDPGLAATRAPLDLAESQGMVLLRQRNARAWRSRLTEFADPTNLECTANKLSLGDFLDERLTATCPLLLLLAGLLMAERVSHELERFEGRFNVILSYDGDSCALRFHRQRPGERWLHADLEEYDEEEGVLVFEAGPAAEGLKLLGTGSAG